jgi:GNAT superfamily N-acetyltransferase
MKVVGSWSLRSAVAEDANWLADLKAAAMRLDLERLGLWDHQWARRRFLDTFIPANSSVIETDSREVGMIAVRPEPDAQWIEHFYLDPTVHGCGLGGRVLAQVMDSHRDHRPFLLAIDRGSAVRRLYERHGFVYQYDGDNGVDQIFRAPGEAA